MSPACPPGPHVGVFLPPPFKGVFLPFHTALTVGRSGTWWAPQPLFCFSQLLLPELRYREREEGGEQVLNRIHMAWGTGLVGTSHLPGGPGPQHPQTSVGPLGCGLVSWVCRGLSALPLPEVPSLARP